MGKFIIAIIYVIYFIGIFLYFIVDSRFLKKKPITTKQGRTDSKIYAHLRKLIYINFSNKKSWVVNAFIILTLLIFVTFMYLTLKVGFIYSIIISSIFASIPYLTLIVRRKYIRVAVSYDAELIITELTNQYKINNNNMIKALESTIKTIDDTHISKTIMTRLTIRAKEYRNEEELQSAIDEFVYSVDTEWAKMLANNLFLSISAGLDVTNSLEDIVKELIIAKSNFEKTDRMNSENIMVAKYLTPMIYIGSVYLAVEFFGYSVRDFFRLQFETSSGINYFVIIVILTFININFMYYMKNRKFDF